MTDDTIHDQQVPPATTTIAEPMAQGFTEAEVLELRRRLGEDSADHGASRFGWFLIGFTAALVSIAVAALVFLAVSDADDDGNINLNVPSVEVDG